VEAVLRKEANNSVIDEVIISVNNKSDPAPQRLAKKTNQIETLPQTETISTHIKAKKPPNEADFNIPETEKDYTAKV
jgi:hypothetical protein